MKKDYPITIGGKVYKFRFNFDALTAIEDLTGKPFGSILNESSLSAWKILFFAGLQKNHPEVTLESVGDLINETENLGALKRDVQKALLNSLGIVAQKPDDGPKKNEPSLKLVTAKSTGRK